MIFNLILKDILGYWRYIVLSIFLPAILWLLLVVIPVFPPKGSVIFCIAAIVAAISYFTFSEKKQKLETLICSLPVTRKSIVMARYLFALLILVIGTAVLYGGIYAAFLLHAKPLSVFHELYNIKSLFISCFIVTTSVCCFFPLMYHYKILGMVLTLPIGFTLGMHLSVSIFHFTKRSYVPYFLESEIPSIIGAAFVMICMVILSIGISNRILERKDL